MILSLLRPSRGAKKTTPRDRVRIEVLCGLKPLGASGAAKRTGGCGFVPHVPDFGFRWHALAELSKRQTAAVGPRNRQVLCQEPGREHPNWRLPVTNGSKFDGRSGSILAAPSNPICFLRLTVAFFAKPSFLTIGLKIRALPSAFEPQYLLIAIITTGNVGRSQIIRLPFHLLGGSNRPGGRR